MRVKGGGEGGKEEGRVGGRRLEVASEGGREGRDWGWLVRNARETREATVGNEMFDLPFLPLFLTLP